MCHASWPRSSGSDRAIPSQRRCNAAMRLAAAMYSARSWSSMPVMERQASQTKRIREDPRDGSVVQNARLDLTVTMAAKDRPSPDKQAAYHHDHHESYTGQHDRGVAVHQPGGSPPAPSLPSGSSP